VTLDLWLTLIAEKDGRQWSQHRNELRLANAIDTIRSRGLLVDEEALRVANRRISDLVSSDHDLGLDLQFNDRVVQLLSMVDERLPRWLGPDGLEEVGAGIDRAFVTAPPSFLPGAKETLERLSAMDIKLALISNTGLTSAGAYTEWFEREGVLHFFDHLTFSNAVACAKPSPEIFNPTLLTLESDAKDAIHIGDNLLADVSGAAGVGMRTGWIKGHDNREPIVAPDYTLGGIADAVGTVERWLDAREMVVG
jgi:FMN phosphatase YigB (HAD superfamily)